MLIRTDCRGERPFTQLIGVIASCLLDIWSGVDKRDEAGDHLVLCKAFCSEVIEKAFMCQDDPNLRPFRLIFNFAG